ncbi:uncharacterized protein [Ptychodera flava]|uniref:uncharacterized protein n=1 Tax=Ptychodera flava TaxID=63121 RepID=UPI00396A381C
MVGQCCALLTVALSLLCNLNVIAAKELDRPVSSDLIQPGSRTSKINLDVEEDKIDERVRNLGVESNQHGLKPTTGYDIVPWVSPGAKRSGLSNLLPKRPGLKPTTGYDIVPWVPPQADEKSIDYRNIIPWGPHIPPHILKANEESNIPRDETPGMSQKNEQGSDREMTDSERIRYIEELDIGQHEANQDKKSLGLKPTTGYDIVPWVPPKDGQPNVPHDETAGMSQGNEQGSDREMTDSELIRYIEELDIGQHEANQDKKSLGLKPTTGYDIVPWVPPKDGQSNIPLDETAGISQGNEQETDKEMTDSELIRYIEELDIGQHEANQDMKSVDLKPTTGYDIVPWVPPGPKRSGLSNLLPKRTGLEQIPDSTYEWIPPKAGQPDDLLATGEKDKHANLEEINVFSLLKDGVDIDALYDEVKSEPDTVIDESDGTLIFKENGTMFEIYGLNELEEEDEKEMKEMSTKAMDNQTFVIMNNAKQATKSTPIKPDKSAKPKLLLSSSGGGLKAKANTGLPRLKPYKPMTSHGLLGPNRRPQQRLLMANGPSTRDPTCPPANGTRDITITDGFYRKVTDDRVEILATSVFLGPDNAIYDPCKDFYLQAVTVTVKGDIKWKGRNVYITAVNLTVIGEKATIDASYQSAGQPDHKLAARDGMSPGEAGQDGAKGGNGNQGGDVKMHIAFLFGGQLEVMSTGGPGGRGQDGGNGREGAAGSPNTDYDACCRGRSTTGNKGGKGGDAGKAGQPGDGGRGGDVTFLTLNQTWEDIYVLYTTSVPSVDVSGGEPGEQAEPGKPGPGGPGGMGSKTNCRSHGMLWWKKKKCEGSNGANGPKGDSGAVAPPAAKAKKGPEGTAVIRSIDIQEFSKYISKEMVQVTLREGNKYYKNGEFSSARDVYLWVYYTGRYSSDLELQKYANQSLLYLRQIAHGLDYWAHGPNNMPLSSYNSIYDYLTNDIVPYARHVESDYNVYFDKATEMQRRQAIIQECMGHNEYSMDVLDKAREDKVQEFQQIKSELSELIHLQREARVSAEGISANCKNAVDIYLVKKKSKMIFKDILNIIGAVVKVFTIAMGGFQSLAGGFGEFVGALESVKELRGKSIFDKIKGVDTIIKDIGGIYNEAKGTIVTTIDSIEEEYEKIKQALEIQGEENSVKIVADGKELQKLLEQYLFLPECKDAKSRIQAYMDISQSVNDKILHHDSTVLKIASLDAQYEVLQLEESRLRSEMGKGYDPTVIDYAIAVGRVYTNLKDAIVDKMKRLQEAYNYQFLENRVFKFDDTRVALLEAWLANQRIQMLDKIEQIGNQVQLFNQDAPPMTNSIVLKREDFPADFENMDRTGELWFAISGKEDQLAPLTHVHMLDVRVWFPGVKVRDDRLRVWLKRYGSSMVYDQNGEPWTFTHAPRTMLFDYNVKDLTLYSGRKSSSKPVNIVYVENTRVSVDDTSDYVALSPIGPWALSVSPQYNPDIDTRKVKEIHLQMSYSFLACSLPVCPPRSFPHNYSADAEADSPDWSDGDYDEIDGPEPHEMPIPDSPDGKKDVKEKDDGSRISVNALIGIIVAGVLVVIMLIAIGTISYRRRNRADYDNVSMTWDYSDSQSSERSPLTAAQSEHVDPWDSHNRRDEDAATANA